MTKIGLLALYLAILAFAPQADSAGTWHRITAELDRVECHAEGWCEALGRHEVRGRFTVPPPSDRARTIDLGTPGDWRITLTTEFDLGLEPRWRFVALTPHGASVVSYAGSIGIDALRPLEDTLQGYLAPGDYELEMRAHGRVAADWTVSLSYYGEGSGGNIVTAIGHAGHSGTTVEVVPQRPTGEGPLLVCYDRTRPRTPAMRLVDDLRANRVIGDVDAWHPAYLAVSARANRKLVHEFREWWPPDPGDRLAVRVVEGRRGPMPPLVRSAVDALYDAATSLRFVDGAEGPEHRIRAPDAPESVLADAIEAAADRYAGAWCAEGWR